MSQQDLDELREKVNELREKVEDLDVDFAGIRRLIKERLAPDQIAKLEELMEEAARFEPLLRRLEQLPQLREDTVNELTAKEFLDRPFRRYFGPALPSGIDVNQAVYGTFEYLNSSLEQLKQMCEERSLSTSGDEKELAVRLWLNEKSV